MNQLTVLTIDDNDSIRLSLASYLEDMGYDVLEADCGESGIELIRDRDVDVVLTDTHMPGLSGIDVLNFVRIHKPDIPVIVISGAGEIKFVVESLRAGAWDYITKPIEDLGFLSYTIEKVMKRFYLIKENREKEEELKQKNIALNNSIELLKSTQKQLVESEKMASLGYMLNGVAHEINTPLGVCMTSTSFLKEQAENIISLNEKKQMKLSDFESYSGNIMELSGIIYKSLTSINNLIINFKQLSMNPGELRIKSFNLKEAISSIILIISSSYPNISVELNITGDDIEIRNYPEVINRILIKLAENSIIHGFSDRGKGTITIDIKVDEQNIIIYFENDGRLIPEEMIDNIFDPFFTENKKGGTGLGLSIVHNLITFTLHGSVSCVNRHSGVLYTMTFPKTQTK